VNFARVSIHVYEKNTSFPSEKTIGLNGAGQKRERLRKECREKKVQQMLSAVQEGGQGGKDSGDTAQSKKCF